MKISFDKRYDLMLERFTTLSKGQLQEIRDNIDIVLFDEYNYHEGKFCPMGVALNQHKTINPTQKSVKSAIAAIYTPSNMLKGVEGTFYHGTNEERKRDLLNLIDMLL